MTLTEFLLARIAEDEQTVRAVTNNGALNAVGGVVAETIGDVYSYRRVLAECEAKRQVVQMYANWKLVPDGKDAHVALHAALRLLAAPYSDHPDFDPAWRTQ